MRNATLSGSLGVLGASVLVCAGCATAWRPDAGAVMIPQGCYTDEEIAEMPLLERPDRPGHFVGNTIRRIYRWHTGEAEPFQLP